jgi:hypothetical protein
MKVKYSSVNGYKGYVRIEFDSQKSVREFWKTAHVDQDFCCAVWVRKGSVVGDASNAVVYRLEPNSKREVYEAVGFILAQIKASGIAPKAMEVFGC